MSTVGFWRTIWADFGPDMSPFLMSRPSMTMPSVEVIPTRRPISLKMWAIIRTVVVLPFVPVTATIGIRAGAPGGKRRSRTGLATYCGSPSVGWVCIRKPGAALTSTIAAAGLADGLADVGADEVDPGDVEADDAGRRLGDLDVVGVGLHRPVDRGPAGRHVAGQGELDPGARRAARRRAPSPASATSSSAASSSRIRVRTFSWPIPRRGSWLAISTSSRTVCSPSPVTEAGTRSATAASLPPMTRHAVVVARR